MIYRDHEEADPLRVRAVEFRAENVRNIKSKEYQYPSSVHLDGEALETGRLRIDGRTDFLSKPYMALHADVDLEHIDLARLLPVAHRAHLFIDGGTLTARGHVEYAPWTKTIQLQTLHLAGAKIDYIYTKSGGEDTKEGAREVRQVAEKEKEKGTHLRIDRGDIEKSTFGFVNKTARPAYRVFLANTDIYLENFSNQLEDGTALVKLRGLFMGSGAAVTTARFRPERQSPDFDLDIQITNTALPAMNDLLRAYGGFDVAKGKFSVFTQLTVKNGRLDGYLKPIFKEVKALDARQDNDKGLLKKIYEGLISSVARGLENEPRGEVATKADLTGPVSNPSANTWELVGGLVENAFFQAILPGLDHRPRGVKSAFLIPAPICSVVCQPTVVVPII